MFGEVLLTTLSSVGGASLVVGGLGAFLGNVWADRIKQSTLAKFQEELAILSARHTRELEGFKAKAAAALKEREAFAGFSSEFYQDFLAKRVEVYRQLLRLENEYRKEMDESFLRLEFEDWHEQHARMYKALRECVTQNELYVSNEAEAAFQNLRVAIAPSLNEADRAEAFAMGVNGDFEGVIDARRKHEQEALTETSALMKAFFEQVRKDVAKVRSRIEMDSPAPLSRS